MFLNFNQKLNLCHKNLNETNNFHCFNLLLILYCISTHQIKIIYYIIY